MGRRVDAERERRSYKERRVENKDLQAFMMVCSLMIMSVVSVRGRDTRDAMAAPSVSRMILSCQQRIVVVHREEDTR